ncbi:MAG TPA: DUF4412 domain-containing protein [Candidatus Angelobacter sp.]|nr:DUF4412 domain-containing protein [Candidatus Angelobacter sp.]
MKQNLMVRVALCALLFVAVPAFAFQMPVPFSADMVIKASHGSLNMTGKIYLAMPKMRMDMSSANEAKSSPMGGKISMIIDQTTKTADMLMLDQHMYMEFPVDKGNPMTQSLPKVQDFLNSGGDPCTGHEGATCKKVGTESIDGRSCDKWEMTEKGGKVETFWMDQKLHFPIKLISGDVTAVYTNIKEGPQDASLFNIPAGFKKLDMSGGRPSH